jgi:hypothetical protein
MDVRIGGRAPANGVEERIDAVWIVELPDFREACLLKNPSTRLQLPNDLQLLAESVFIDGRQRQQVLPSGSRKAGTGDVRDDPLASAHIDQLALLGSFANVNGS